MGWYIQTAGKKKKKKLTLLAENALPGKTVFQKWRQDKDFLKQIWGGSQPLVLPYKKEFFEQKQKTND